MSQPTQQIQPTQQGQPQLAQPIQQIQPHPQIQLQDAQPKLGGSIVDINKLLADSVFVNMIRDYIDKKKEETPKVDENKELKENIESQNQTLEQALNENLESGVMNFDQKDPNLNKAMLEGENPNLEQTLEKKKN